MSKKLKFLYDLQSLQECDCGGEDLSLLGLIYRASESDAYRVCVKNLQSLEHIPSKEGAFNHATRTCLDAIEQIYHHRPSSARAYEALASNSQSLLKLVQISMIDNLDVPSLNEISNIGKDLEQRGLGNAESVIDFIDGCYEQANDFHKNVLSSSKQITPAGGHIYVPQNILDLNALQTVVLSQRQKLLHSYKEKINENILTTL